MRAADPGNSLHAYRDRTWVECPKCANAAHVEPAKGILACVKCGHRELDFQRSAALGGKPFGENGPSLFITAQVAGHELWVFNLEHLQALLTYIEAPLRERNHDSRRRNSTMMSRLPQWLKRATNREKAIRALKRMKSYAKSNGVY